MAMKVVSTQKPKKAFPIVLTVTLAVLALAYAGIGFAWMHENGESDDLKRDIQYNQSQLAASKEISPLEERKVELAAARADLTSTFNEICPGAFHNINVINELAAIGESAGGVEITAITRAKAGGYEPFSGGQYTIAATGEMDSLLSLVAHIVEDRQVLAGAAIEHLFLDNPEDTEGLPDMLLTVGIADNLTDGAFGVDDVPGGSLIASVAAN